MDKFWARWTREYISLVQGRQKWLKQQRNLRFGDVVLVVDRQTPGTNGHWAWLSRW